MIQAEIGDLEVRLLDDGAVQARRKDRRHLTEADWIAAYRWAGMNSSPANEIARIFPGAKVIAPNKPLFCRHCHGDLAAEYSRPFNAGAPTSDLLAFLEIGRGKIVEISEPDGAQSWSCHYCGRRA